jgi:hypothetical protein
LSSAVPPNCLLTRISARDSKFAAIVVGPKKARFTVHEELLTYHSPYFRAALTGGFKEAEDKAVTLSEERVPIVEFFVHWLYYQCLPNADDPIDLYDAWNDGEADGELMTSNLIELYVFGDKFDVPGLKSQAMTDLLSISRTWRVPSSLQRTPFASRSATYPNTPRSSSFSLTPTATGRDHQCGNTLVVMTGRRRFLGACWDSTRNLHMVIVIGSSTKILATIMLTETARSAWLAR